MNWLMRKYRLLRLKIHCEILLAQAEHAEALLEDHSRRYRILIRELSSARRRLMALEDPQVLLTKQATNV